MKHAVIASMAIGIALAAAVPASAADQLRASVSHQFQRLGFDAGALDRASNEQVSQIELILGASRDRSNNRAQIERVLQ
jgi:hypothetical protein